MCPKHRKPKEAPASPISNFDTCSRHYLANFLTSNCFDGLAIDGDLANVRSLWWNKSWELRKMHTARPILIISSNNMIRSISLLYLLQSCILFLSQRVVVRKCVFQAISKQIKLRRYSWIYCIDLWRSSGECGRRADGDNGHNDNGFGSGRHCCDE